MLDTLLSIDMNTIVNINNPNAVTIIRNRLEHDNDLDFNMAPNLPLYIPN